MLLIKFRKQFSFDSFSLGYLLNHVQVLCSIATTFNRIHLFDWYVISIHYSFSEFLLFNAEIRCCVRSWAPTCQLRRARAIHSSIECRLGRTFFFDHICRFHFFCSENIIFFYSFVLWRFRLFSSQSNFFVVPFVSQSYHNGRRNKNRKRKRMNEIIFGQRIIISRWPNFGRWNNTCNLCCAISPYRIEFGTHTFSIEAKNAISNKLIQPMWRCQ